MPKVLARSHSVQWGNPYTHPPDGGLRVRVRVEVPYHDARTPKEVSARLEELGGPGSGWAHCVSFVEEEPRRLPLSSKQSIRRKRLWARLERKHPLFAEQFYEEALGAKPDYYGVDPETLRPLRPPNGRGRPATGAAHPPEKEQ